MFPDESVESPRSLWISTLQKDLKRCAIEW